jgi:multidrug transporter EmrE-like cation transporter
MLFGAVLYAETPGILSICGLCFTITAVILLNYERN